MVARYERRGTRADEPVCKPDPVPGHLTVHRSATIHLGLPSPAGSSGPPAGSGGQPSNACAAARRCGLSTLLRVGFTEPPRSPGVLVVSYTTVSPSPPIRGSEAVCSLWHCPAGRPGLPLTTTLPCGVRTFLDGTGSEPGSRRGRPTDSSAPPSIAADRAAPAHHSPAEMRTSANCRSPHDAGLHLGEASGRGGAGGRAGGAGGAQVPQNVMNGGASGPAGCA